MEETFPQTLFISVGGSGADTFLNASKTEEAAIKGTENEETADVAVYQLVSIRKRTLVTSVQDAE